MRNSNLRSSFGRASHWIGAVLIVGLLLSSCGDPEKRANALFVETSTEISTAWSESNPVARFKKLLGAQTKLDALLKDYPETAAAVRVAGNDKIGPVSRAELASEIQKLRAEPAVCALSVTLDCVERSALRMAGADESTSTRDEFLLDEIGIALLAGDKKVADSRIHGLGDASRRVGSSRMNALAFGFAVTSKLLSRPGSFCGEMESDFSTLVPSDTSAKDRIKSVISRAVSDHFNYDLQAVGAGDIQDLYAAVSGCKGFEDLLETVRYHQEKLQPKAWDRLIDLWPPEKLFTPYRGRLSEAQADTLLDRVANADLGKFADLPASSAALERAVERAQSPSDQKALRKAVLEKSGRKLKAKDYIDAVAKIDPVYWPREYMTGIVDRLRSDRKGAAEIALAWRLRAEGDTAVDAEIWEIIAAKGLKGAAWEKIQALARQGSSNIYTLQINNLFKIDSSVSLGDILDMYFVWASNIDRHDVGKDAQLSLQFRYFRLVFADMHNNNDRFLSDDDYFSFYKRMLDHEISPDENYDDAVRWLLDTSRPRFPELEKLLRAHVAKNYKHLSQLLLGESLRQKNIDQIIDLLSRYKEDDRADMFSRQLRDLNDGKMVTELLAEIYKRLGPQTAALIDFRSICDSSEMARQCHDIAVSHVADENAFYDATWPYIRKLWRAKDVSGLAAFAFNDTERHTDVRIAAAGALLSVLRPEPRVEAPVVRAHPAPSIRPTEKAPSAPAPAPAQSGSSPASTAGAGDVAQELLAAVNGSGVSPDLARGSVLKCVADLKQRFPHPSNDMVGKTCGCFAGRLKSLTHAPDGSDRTTVPTQEWNAAITDCGTVALSRLNAEESGLPKLRGELLDECRRNPKGFGVESSGDAAALCTCLWSTIAKNSRAALTMYAHLGARDQLDKPLAQAISVCVPAEKLNALPFEGRWAPVDKSCDKVNDEDFHFLFRATRYWGWESECNIRDIVKKGDEISFNETCSSQETVSKSAGKIRYNGAKMYMREGDKWKQYRKCPPQPWDKDKK